MSGDSHLDHHLLYQSSALCSCVDMVHFLQDVVSQGVVGVVVEYGHFVVDSLLNMDGELFGAADHLPGVEYQIAALPDLLDPD